MASYAAELEEHEEEEEEDDPEARALAKTEKLCVAKKIPLLQLESSRRAMLVIRQLELLEKLSISALRTEYKTRGRSFAPDFNLRREQLLAQVKDAVIWENLKLEDLQNLCRQKQLPVEAAMSRSSLMQLLAEPCNLMRFDVQHFMVFLRCVEVEQLHAEDMVQVQKRYKALDLPVGQLDDQKQRVSESLFWEALPLSELLEECEMRGVKMGIPVSRLGDAQSAALVAEEWRSLANITSMTVEVSGGSALQVDAGLERHDLVQLLKDVAVWESMPIHELKLEVAKSTGPAVCDRGTQQATQRLRLDEFRQHCQLVEQLLLRRCAEFYEGKGIPARRLGSLKAAANLAKDAGGPARSFGASSHELADLDRQESSTLKSECRRLGVPADHLRQQAWGRRALPAAELRLECRAKSVACPQPQSLELLHRLTSTLWPPPPPPPPPPPEPKPKAKPMKFEQFNFGNFQNSQNFHNFKKPVPPAKARASKNLTPHFKTLGIAPSAGAADVKKAYRKLALILGTSFLKYHPDKNLEASKEEASRRFREVAEAYAALNQFLGA
eukprot:Skav202532  [mRNA]  locus=scaffold2011:141643:153520:- [translate_table: standard]